MVMEMLMGRIFGLEKLCHRFAFCHDDDWFWCFSKIYVQIFQWPFLLQRMPWRE